MTRVRNPIYIQGRISSVYRGNISGFCLFSQRGELYDMDSRTRGAFSFQLVIASDDYFIVSRVFAEHAVISLGDFCLTFDHSHRPYPPKKKKSRSTISYTRYFFFFFLISIICFFFFFYQKKQFARGTHSKDTQTRGTMNRTMNFNYRSSRTFVIAK